MDEPLNLTIDAAALDEHMGSENVIVREGQRIVKGALDVGLRRKVDDVGGLVGGKDALYEIALLEVPLHKMVARVAPNGKLHVLLVCAIVHGVQIHEDFDALGKIMINEMAADEAVAAGHEEAHEYSNNDGMV